MAAAKVKVRFIQSPTRKPYHLAYSVGHYADIDKATAEQMVKDGIAEIIEAKKPRAKAKQVKKDD